MVRADGHVNPSLVFERTRAVHDRWCSRTAGSAMGASVHLGASALRPPLAGGDEEGRSAEGRQQALMRLGSTADPLPVSADIRKHPTASRPSACAVSTSEAQVAPDRQRALLLSASARL